MSHTKEPWIFELPDADHEGIIIGRHGGEVVDGEFSEANARRIVACVNACEGISNDALDSWMNPPEGGFGHPHGPWPAHIISLQRATETVAQQRNDLVEAIRQTLDENGHLADGDVCTLKRLKDALAKVGARETAPEGHNAKVEGDGERSSSISPRTPG
jgi:hypothetical protein